MHGSSSHLCLRVDWLMCHSSFRFWSLHSYDLVVESPRDAFHDHGAASNLDRAPPFIVRHAATMSPGKKVGTARGLVSSVLLEFSLTECSVHFVLAIARTLAACPAPLSCRIEMLAIRSGLSLGSRWTSGLRPNTN